VLEEVGEAGPAFGLQPEPGPVVHPHRNRRRAALRAQHHVQPVRQPLAANCGFGCGSWPGHGG
jgi:hypothetical protein